jgi:exonuclease SbcC
VTLASAEIQNFQSIGSALLDFEKFTVLVGPSSSGKSAVLRALRALLRNTFVPSNVRQGKTKASVTVYLNDHQISMERGKSLSTYYLDGEAYPKSGRSVPDPILKVLKLPLIEGVDPTFSFQFDRPFLLSEPGSVAANVIGSLTNVSMLHAATREANRRRTEASGVLRVRQADVERLSERVETFRHLPARKKALQKAREGLQSVQELAAQADTLRTVLGRLEAAQGFLEGVELPEVPDIEDQIQAIEDAVFDQAKYVSAVERIEAALTLVQSYGKLITEHDEQIQQLREEYDAVLREAGVCPTCGKPTHA